MQVKHIKLSNGQLELNLLHRFVLSFRSVPDKLAIVVQA